MRKDRVKDFNVAFFEAFDEEAELLKGFAPADIECFYTAETIQESGYQSPPAEILSIRTQSTIPPAWAAKLRAIVTRSTGYDHVAAYLRTTGVALPAAHLPQYCARAVAEQALMMLLTLSRKVRLQTACFESFHRDGLTGRELFGRTMTVVGVGNIGGEMARIGTGLGMTVLGVDIVERDEMRGLADFSYAPLASALRTSGVVVSALPLTEITRGMLDKNLLANLPRGAVFVNVSRGEVSPPADLLELLRAGHLGGVGLDVFDYETDLASVLRDGKSVASLAPESRRQVAAVIALKDRPDTILTPHNAFNTIEAVERKARQTFENIVHFIEKGEFLTPLPSTSAAHPASRG